MVDSSSTETLTFPSLLPSTSSLEDVRSFSWLFWKFVLSFYNRTVDHNECDLTSRQGLDVTLVSDTIRYSSLVDLTRVLGLLRYPMDLFTFVSEERRDGEGTVWQELSRLLYTIGLDFIMTVKVRSKRSKGGRMYKVSVLWKTKR